MLIIKAKDVQQSLSVPEIIDCVKAGILKFDAGEYLVPERLHIENEHLTYLVMPAVGNDYMCTKLVSVAPSNKSKSLPIVTGSVVLSDARSGETVAVMDAPMITALRTAAVGAIGLDLIGHNFVESVGIIGCGVQGLWQAVFAHNVRNYKTLYCFSRTECVFENYKEQVLFHLPHVEVVWCATSEALVRQAEIVYGCTTASSPVFMNDIGLVLNKKFISVGSFKPEMQEFPDCVYASADFLIVDSDTAMSEAGDVINSLRNGSIFKHQILKLSEVISEKVLLDKEKNNVFKSVGMAAFDLALAEALYLKIKNS